ncbi:hypothetical protein VTN31DRAFT_129 [Thermomyces dupontii]|uniref:uncharacterized protein n=1 Tax=Talaromyces thermophilus TaxID=28565 RepID=UPI003743D4F7
MRCSVLTSGESVLLQLRVCRKDFLKEGKGTGEERERCEQKDRRVVLICGWSAGSSSSYHFNLQAQNTRYRLHSRTT